MNNKHYKKNGTEVFINDGKDFEFFIRKFNKKVHKFGILRKAVEKKAYEPPSQKRNRKLAESISRCKREALKGNKYLD